MRTATQTLRAVIYLRQSLDRDDDRLAIDRQLRKCQELCEQRGWAVVHVNDRDNNQSATRGSRKGYTELLEMAGAGGVDVIVILRIDRLLRLSHELEALIDLANAGNVKVATVEGDIDLSTPQGRLIARLLVSVSQGEMEVKGERHRLANSQKAAAGKPHGSRRPYGYSDLTTICEPEAEILREMARKVIAGYSMRDVAYWLNREGHKTTTDKLWYPITVRNMLAKKRYRGIIEYDGVEYKAAFKAVFDEETARNLDAALRLRPRVPAATKYLLTGLLHCGACGTKLNGETKRDRANGPKRRVYFCRVQGDTQKQHGCGGVRRNAEALDHFIREVTIFRLSCPELAGLLQDDEPDDGEVQDLLARHAASETRKREIEKDYARREIDRAQFRRMNADLRAEAEEIQRELDAIDRRRLSSGLIPVGQTIRETWEQTESQAWRRQLIRLAGVEKVIVHPSARKPFYDVDGQRMRFDPEAIQLVLTDGAA